MHSFPEIVKELRRQTNVLITAHVSPDSDAIGSAVGLALGLRSLNARTSVYFVDGVPEKYLSLLTDVEVLRTIPNEKYSASIITDTASKPRIGKDADAFMSAGKESFNIDHHISNDGWARWNYIDPTAASCSQIILRILEALAAKIDPQIANLLYAGILDDTGQFRYGNTNCAVLDAASRLVKFGAQPNEVSLPLHFTISANVVALRAKALSAFRVVDQRIGLLVVTTEMMTSCNASSSDTEGLVDEARAIAGTVVTIFIRQLTEGWKVSLRSKAAGLDVNAIAAKFGGGGHTAASGCTLVGTQEEVEAAILFEVKKALHESGL